MCCVFRRRLVKPGCDQEPGHTELSEMMPMLIALSGTLTWNFFTIPLAVKGVVSTRRGPPKRRWRGPYCGKVVRMIGSNVYWRINVKSAIRSVREVLTETSPPVAMTVTPGSGSHYTRTRRDCSRFC